MPTQAEIEASARVLCRIAYYQLPPNERICSADIWPDVDVKPDGRRPNTSSKRWETFEASTKHGSRSRRPKLCERRTRRDAARRKLRNIAVNQDRVHREARAERAMS
jgi:hypothetical protein